MKLTAWILTAATVSTIAVASLGSVAPPPPLVGSLPYHHLVLEGGGVRAVSYVGALHALTQLGYYTNGRYTFRRIGGTSSGCLVGLAVALDVPAARLEELVYTHVPLFDALVDFDARQLLVGQDVDNDGGDVPADGADNHSDSDEAATGGEHETGGGGGGWYNLVWRAYTLLTRVNYFLGRWRSRNAPGLSGEQRLVAFVRDQLGPQSPHRDQLAPLLGTMTFAQLEALTGHQLACFATSLTTRRLVEFSPETTPHWPVVRALYASMAVPGLFKPLDDGHGNALVDGALLMNFPITMNDAADGTADDHTLGLSLAEPLPEACPRAAASQDAATTTTTCRFGDTAGCGYSVAVAADGGDDDGDGGGGWFANRWLPTAAEKKRSATPPPIPSPPMTTAKLFPPPPPPPPPSAGDESLDSQQTPEQPSPFPLYERFGSVGAFVTALYSTLVDREVSLYERCRANRNRVVYLESPVRALTMRVPARHITLSINRAYRNTMVSLAAGTVTAPP